MQLALSDGLPLSMVAVLLVLKMVVILAVLRGGAEGGLLTRAGGGRIGQPAALRVLAARLPGGDKSSFAVVGAAAFLAASMQMPLTAVALVMEFTHMDHSYLAPALLCAAGAF